MGQRDCRPWVREDYRYSHSLTDRLGPKMKSLNRVAWEKGEGISFQFFMPVRTALGDLCVHVTGCHRDYCRIILLCVCCSVSQTASVRYREI